MCSTCGCGETNKIELKRPKGGDVKEITPLFIENNHRHDHSHHSHDHSHDHHHHQEQNIITLEQDILSANNLLAERNKGYFEAKNILTFNLVSSPGSGKTSVLERTLKELNGKFKFSVIEGDQQTTQDADRISATKVPVIQINTGQGCHLDSDMINKALKELNPEDDSILFIENVGNLICPALFKLGEDKRIVIISVTEGEDKPLKYPDMFASADICLINKIDLLPYVDFNVEKAKEYALRINHNLQFIELSARTGEGMENWYELLNTLKTTSKS